MLRKIIICSLISLFTSCAGTVSKKKTTLPVSKSNLPKCFVIKIMPPCPVIKAVMRDVLVISPIYFAPGKSNLSLTARATLHQLAKVLKAMDRNIKIVEVVGHADEKGTKFYNMELSNRRAETVVWYLMDIGVDPTLLYAKWVGETKPAVKNPITPEQQTRNRRVEIKVIKWRE